MSDSLGDDIDALAVGVHDVLPILNGLIQHVLRLVEAVADSQNVDAAVLGDASVHDLLEIIVIGRIGGGESAVDALGNELVLQSLQLGSVTAGHEDLGAGVAISLGQHAAQSAGSAGDESDLALDGEHIVNKILFNSNHFLFPPVSIKP